MSSPQVADFAAVETLARESGGRKTPRHEIERAAVIRRDRAARDERPRELQRLAFDVAHVRSSSLIDVLARVCASTRLTITAHDSEYFPSDEGRLPGTTTEPAGTLP